MSQESQPLFIQKSDFDLLIAELRSRDYTTVGPTVDQGAIVYDEIFSLDDLPRGWTDKQEAGTYQLERRTDDAVFGYVVGPHSWKKFLFPPVVTVSTADRTESGWQMATPDPDDEPRFAFIGVRACELAAIRIQDQVFAGGQYIDPIYSKRRENAFIVAVNCTQAAPTCFCTSTGTGPRCESGFDIAVTEIAEGFLLEAGSEQGTAVTDRLPTKEPTTGHLTAADTARQAAVDQISRRLDTTELRDLLLGNLEHPHWDDVAERCLSCTNCTMVCPTCFCSTVDDVADLTGDHVTRERKWDSCFNVDFSYMNGGIARNSIRSRYRQWLVHKLASWHDQFDTSGCVGCGRCITWCPTEIDLTAEVRAIRDDDRRPSPSPNYNTSQ